MSNWIKVTNLPFYYDEEEAVTMFGDVGSIKRIQIERVQLLLKSTAFIQFVNAKKARLAAIKKDQIVFADAVIRVYVVWNRKESLTTVKVSNLPSDVTEVSLMEYFSPYGDIVDIDFNKSRDQLVQENEEDTDQSWCDEKMNEQMGKEMVALISFARVDYALRACQEMDHSIISSAGDNSRLSVKLVNPDARNAKWKRNLFEYVRCTVPSKRSRTKPESGVKSSTKVNNSFSKENVSRPHQSNSSECWFTSQVNPTSSKTTPIFPPMSGSGSTLNTSNEALNESRFDNSSVPQTHNSVPRLLPNNVTNTSTSSNFMVCGDPRFGNGGMVPCGYTSLVFPNSGFVTNGNINTYLTVPHNANFVTPMSSVSTPPLTSGLAYPTQLITSPSNGPFLSTQVNNMVDTNYAWSQNQVPTLPSIQISGTTSVPSVISNQSTSSSVTNSTQKVIANDSSNTTSLKKTSARSTASVSSAHSNASSSSVWSNKQREMGDVIYRELQSEFPTRVAKLTGMLLSLPEDELSRLLTDSHKLKARALQFCQLLDSK